MNENERVLIYGLQKVQPGMLVNASMAEDESSDGDPEGLDIPDLVGGMEVAEGKEGNQNDEDTLFHGHTFPVFGCSQ